MDEETDPWQNGSLPHLVSPCAGERVGPGSLESQALALALPSKNCFSMWAITPTSVPDFSGSTPTSPSNS